MGNISFIQFLAKKKRKFYSMKLNFYSMNFWLFSDFLTVLDLSTIGNVPGFEDRSWYQQPTHTHSHSQATPPHLLCHLQP